MSIFRLVGYRIGPGNRGAVAAWFASAAGQHVLRRMTADTRVGYAGTYFTIGQQPSLPGANDVDEYDLWEAPDLASFDRLPESPAYAEFEGQFHPLIIDRSWTVVHLEPVNPGGSGATDEARPGTLGGAKRGSKYMLVGARIKPGNRGAVATWYGSDDGQELLRRIKAETDVRLVGTYFTIEDSSKWQAGDFDFYDLWEAPELAAFKRLRESPAVAQRLAQIHPLLVDQSWKPHFLEPASG